MCGKKNNVLFTETECLVLSPNFKLLDESQVLLRILRQSNMYSFDLQNVVPSRNLTCLFSKASIDESNLWHKRIGHVNFKTMNKVVKENLVRGTQDNVDAGKKVFDQYHIMLPLWFSISLTYKSSNDKAKDDKTKDDTGSKTIMEPDNKEDQAYIDELDKLMHQEKEASDAADSLSKEFEQGCLDQKGAAKAGSTNSYNTVSNPVNAASTSETFSAGGPSSPHPDAFIPDDTLLHFKVWVQRLTLTTWNLSLLTNHKDYENCLFACSLSRMEPKKVAQALNDESWVEAMQDELFQFSLQKVWRLVDLPYGKKAIRTKWVYRNKKDERGIVVKNKARLVAQGHRQEEGIDYDVVFVHVARTEAIKIFLASASYMRRGIIDKTLFIKKDKDDIMLVQMSSMGELTFFLGVQVKQSEEGIFISQDKYVAGILKKFDFSSVRTASTPIETQKLLVNDEEVADVTPKLTHLHAMKRIFRYLKGQPKLGLWYPIDSPFDLEAYSDSDYAGANLDRKSTTGGCQFLERRLISWQCKKQTIIATSTTEAEGPNFLDLSVDVKAVHKEGLIVCNPPLSTGNMVGNRKDSMEYEIELTDLIPQTPYDLPLSKEKVKTAQAKVIASLKKRVTKLEQRQSSRILGFHSFRAEVIVEDKGSGEKGSSTAEIVSTTRPDISTARPDISAARTEVSTIASKTPLTTTTLFDDEYVTIDDTLVKMKSQKAKEKGGTFKDTDDFTRPIKSITTLQPLLTIDPKDKGKSILQEPETVKKTKKKDKD
nr:hypothetical protein [Tanacetum cinerariifolium]